MKKIYILLLPVIILVNLKNNVIAQSVLNPNDPIVEYDPETPPVEPPYGQIGRWVRTKTLAWNSTSYKCYIYKGSCFRLKFPKSYVPNVADGKKYPLALVFHGGGEAGPLTDNERQLYHGGLPYQDAADNGKYDGYILFMQSQGYWGTTSYSKIIEIINYMIANNKLDGFTISVNGLSSGGQASWDMVNYYPNYTTASLPMSNVSIGYKESSFINKVKFTPLWNFQGALDGSPSPSTAEQVADAMANAGANFKYSEYVDIGHNTWDSAFAEPDFFPYMLRSYASNPYTLYGRTGFCTGNVINLTVGLPPGYDNYQWKRNDTIIAGATSNTINVTSLGTYTARVQRGSTWSEWSRIPVKIQITPPTITPPITVSGLMSNVITAADGKNYVNLEVPNNGYTSYKWKKVGSDSIVGTSRIYTATQPGQYIAAVTELYGCSSVYSPPFTVVNAAGTNAPDAATNLTAAAVSSTQTALNWENNPHPAFNETFFEVYRGTAPNGPYVYAGKSPADSLGFNDASLPPGTTFYYRVRAVNNNGAAVLSNIASTATQQDKTPPSAPNNLQILYVTNSSMSLQWDSSFDNVGLKNYLVYVNGVKTYTTTKNNIIVNSLEQGKVYSFYIKAVDVSGNYSTQSNIASAPAVLKGLLYKYYEGYWLLMPDFNTLTPLATNVTPNITLAPARRQIQFAFLWQGSINVPVTGTYKFSMSSNDGSILWLKTYDPAATPLINNDGERSGIKTKTASILLQKGTYPITIGYFQTKNTKGIQLSWANAQVYGDTAQHIIEDKYFAGIYTPAGTSPTAPDNLADTVLSYDKIKLTWTDRSNNETAFQVYRAAKYNGPYSIIYTTGANATEFTDSNLTAATKYFYKINSVNSYGTSILTNYVQGITLKLPLPPKQPTGVTATPLSASMIRLNWMDADTTETNYQVLRSAADSFHFKTAAILPANSVTFTDTALYGNTIYFYKVKALTATATSINKSALITKTLNTPPIILNKFNNKNITYGLQTVLNLSAFDADADPVSFSVVNLPSFANFVNNGNGSATVTFNPSIANQGTYNNIKIYALDTLGGLDSNIFTLVVYDNYNPSINSISDYNLNEGDIATVPLTATDPNASDVLSWSVSGLPGDYSIVPVSNGSVNLVLKPTYAAAGVYTVLVTVNDGRDGTATREFKLSVNDKDPNQIVYMRFKDQTTVGSPWNNITGVTSTNFKDDFGRTTSVGLSMQTGWWAVWHEGPQTGNNSGVYPDAVLKEYYYFGIFGGPETVTSKFTGLDTSRSYDINFYGGSSWVGAADNGTTVYTIGSQSIPLYVQNNTSNTANFTNIKPAADGTIAFTMAKAANTPVGYVNAIVLKALYKDTLLPAKPTFLVAENAVSKGVKLSWNDVAYNETGYRVSRATSLSGTYTQLPVALPFNTTSYTDTSAGGHTQYYYYVTAVNDKGASPTSDTVSIFTNNLAPKIKPIANVSIKNNQQTTVNVITTDDAGDVVTLTASNLPSFVTFTDNGNGTGVFNVVPSGGVTGIYDNVTIKASDNYDSSSTAIFTITITDQKITSLYLNFSDGSLATAPWNNLTGWPVSGKTFTDLYDDNSALTPVTVKLLNGFQGVVAGGMQANNGRNIYPQVVMRTAEYEGSSKTDSMLVSGLSANKKYNFVFFNSHDDGMNGTTNFTINNQTVTLNAAYNLNKTVQINGILADAGGQVTIKVAKAANADYAYLNSIIIQTYDSALTLLTPGDLTVAGITRKTVALQWADRSFDETGFEIWRASDSSQTYTLLKTVAANKTSYIDSNLYSNKTYYYSVRAVKSGQQSDFCNTVSATTYRQAVFVNFTYTNNANVPWNNTFALPEDGYTWSNFMDDAGVPSSLGTQLVGNFAGLYGAGMVTGNNSGIYPDKVMADSYGLFTGETAVVKVNGLNLNMKYDLTFFASSQAYGDVNVGYTVNGKKCILNASLNTSGNLTIYGISPDVNGEISITIGAATFSSQFGLIGALVVQEYGKNSNAIPPVQMFSPVAKTKNAESLTSAKTGKPVIKTSVYPNPFTHDFTVSAFLEKDDDVMVSFYDVNGRQVLSKNFGSLKAGNNTLKITPDQSIAPGVYLVKLTFVNSKTIQSLKVLKQ